jgi:hypothetical protein
MLVVENALIPPQNEGKQNDLTHTVSYTDSKEARLCFQRACERMRNPGKWRDMCGILSADFRLIGNNGLQAHTQVKKGDYLQVDIPGPGTKAGEGYDWVKVEHLEHIPAPAADNELCGMQLRPCANPKKQTKDTAHFFMGNATSTFIIRRHGNEVTASYHGRNELPNVSTGNKVDNFRNAMITSGAMAGLSELQWHTLIKAFLEEGKKK